MEIEEGKVEIYEIDLGFCLIHVLYMVLTYGYLMGSYRIERKYSGMNKMIVLGAKQILNFPNFFTYYEQDMAKSMILLDYYNNVYEGHYEKWQIMILVEREDEWMKDIITIEELKQRLRINCNYGWSFHNYLYTPSGKECAKIR
jgi:hypothetical protein